MAQDTWPTCLVKLYLQRAAVRERHEPGVREQGQMCHRDGGQPGAPVGNSDDARVADPLVQRDV